MPTSRAALLERELRDFDRRVLRIATGLLALLAIGMAVLLTWAYQDRERVAQKERQAAFEAQLAAIDRATQQQMRERAFRDELVTAFQHHDVESAAQLTQLLDQLAALTGHVGQARPIVVGERDEPPQRAPAPTRTPTRSASTTTTTRPPARPAATTSTTCPKKNCKGAK